MRRNLLPNALLVATCVAQLAVLVGMIASAERTLQTGREWRFRTAPIDPVDPFRGRYARLNFPTVSVPVEGDPLAPGDRVFARIEADAEGFARFASLHPVPPGTPDYLELSVLQAQRERASVRLPFDRFYMDEERAPDVDRSMLGRRRTAWARVRVHRGRGVVTNIHVEDAGPPPDLERSLLRVWPDEARLPDSLLPTLQAELDSRWGAPCREQDACVLAAVDLDDRVEDEWVLALGPRLSWYLYVTPLPVRRADDPAWGFERLQRVDGALPRTPDEMIGALDEHGSRGEVAPTRLLRLGEGRLRAP